MVALTGPLATASREPRQARKGATVVVTLCAEVRLVRVTAIFPRHFSLCAFLRLVFLRFFGPDGLCRPLEPAATLVIELRYYALWVAVVSSAHKTRFA